MGQSRRLGWPITLATVMIVMLVALIVGSVFMAMAASEFSGYWWAVLAVEIVFLVLMLVGVVLYLTISLKEIGLNQRQSNFIDSVTHELKSPIASLKLYVQTLMRRNVTEAQQADFHRFMLDDLERLDALINHMLDAARISHDEFSGDLVDVPLEEILESCAHTACQRYRLPNSTIELDLSPAIVRARPIDVEMVFRNLIDNALKYSGAEAHVEIQSWVDGRGSVITRVADNGPGIPAKLRRKIFGRFVRLGSELERSATGTGLGLFIVRTLVKRLHGKIQVRSRGSQPGTVFEVQLPGRAGTRATPLEPKQAAV